MNNFESKLLVLAVASALASVAHAEEYNWTGFKLGIGGGGGANVAKNRVHAGHDVGNATYSSGVSNSFGTTYDGAPTWHDSYSASRDAYRNFINSTYSGLDERNSNFVGDSTYASDYQTEAFMGEVGRAVSDIGKSMAFGTIDFSLDKQVGKMVFGIVGNYDFAKKRKANSQYAGGQAVAFENNAYYSYTDSSPGYPGNSYSSNDYYNHATNAHTAAYSSFQTQDSGALGLRLGFLPTDSTLVYATAGWAGIKIKQKTTYESGIADGTSMNAYPDLSYNYSDTASSSNFKNGYFIGAGIQTKLTENSSFKLEYRYADYGKVHNRKTNNSASITETSYGPSSLNNYNDFSQFNNLYGISYIDQSTELQQHTVRAVISYDF